MAKFYLENLSSGLCTKALAINFLREIVQSVKEFNELHLFLLKSTLESAFVSERSKFAEDDEAAGRLMFQGD